MGRDKALLPHPHGGSLLQHTCALALATGLETVCLSRPHQGHRQHLATAAGRAPELRQVTVLEEQPPWEGPLLALAKLMTICPGRPMVLLACDLPHLGSPLLNALAAPLPPRHARLTTDGAQQQPLLATYGSDLAATLHQAVAAGVRSFRQWLPGLQVEWLRVPSTALVNLNHPQDLASFRTALGCNPSSQVLCSNRSGSGQGLREARRGDRPEGGLKTRESPPLQDGEYVNTSTLDQLGRTLGVLRLSLTARCNLACRYCRPENQDPRTLLTHQQRLKLVGVAARLGCRRLRLTGGEPLLAPGLAPLIQAVKALDLVEEVALTSNGVLLDRSLAQDLKQAGLDRITISLDGADPQAVLRMGGGHSFAQVLAAIDNAQAVGLPVKINMVVMAHGNGDQVVPMARLCRELGVELRLIEYMDVGNRNGWRPQQVLTAAAMTARIASRWPLQSVGRQPGATARRWRYGDGGGFVSTIASISEPFCGDCNRLRVTADGVAYTCLFASQGTDLKPALDPRQPDAVLMRQLVSLWRQRRDRYSEERASRQVNPTPRPSPAEMAYIGG